MQQLRSRLLVAVCAFVAGLAAGRFLSPAPRDLKREHAALEARLAARQEAAALQADSLAAAEREVARLRRSSGRVETHYVALTDTILELVVDSTAQVLLNRQLTLHLAVVDSLEAALDSSASALDRAKRLLLVRDSTESEQTLLLRRYQRELDAALRRQGFSLSLRARGATFLLGAAAGAVAIVALR